MSMGFMPVMALSGFQIAMIVIVVLIVAATVALYFYGSKMQKKQAEAEKQMQVGAQTVSMLVIDKKIMKLKEAGFPQLVIDQTPKYLRGSKVPVVKAKVGPKIMTFMCDNNAFEVLPVKKEVKVVLNGIYIMEVKGARGGLEQKEEKVGFFKRMQRKLTKKRDELAAEEKKNK